eukprot:5530495-Pyramimonas_sp.AAC.1
MSAGPGLPQRTFLARVGTLSVEPSARLASVSPAPPLSFPLPPRPRTRSEPSGASGGPGALLGPFADIPEALWGPS